MNTELWLETNRTFELKHKETLSLTYFCSFAETNCWVIRCINQFRAVLWWQVWSRDTLTSDVLRTILDIPAQPQTDSWTSDCTDGETWMKTTLTLNIYSLIGSHCCGGGPRLNKDASVMNKQATWWSSKTQTIHKNEERTVFLFCYCDGRFRWMFKLCHHKNMIRCVTLRNVSTTTNSCFAS